jgi:SSS family solute:Na+ symporter
VFVGRAVSLLALGVALMTAKPLLGEFDQAYQYIQEFTGFFTPGIVVLFMLGMFWRRTTPLAALLAAIGSAVLSLLFKLFWPELPFMDRVGLVFISCLLLAIVVSLYQNQGEQANAVKLDDIQFSTRSSFNLSAALVSLILVAFYAAWW